MKTIAVILLILILCAASFTGCGRKSSPVYRETVKVNNLKGII